MVWLIDNSGSMTEEAAQVRANFQNFLTTLSQRTDIRLALISATAEEGSTGVTLPQSLIAAGHIQIGAAVDSTNELILAAAATCAAGESEGLSSPRVCGQNLGEDLFFDVGAIDAVKGRLQSFFRPDASRVYVIVTDDNAEGVDQSNFLSLVRPYEGIAPPVVFAFRGTVSQGACDISARGVAYEALAQATGGAVFDICDPDWRSNFSRLTSEVVALATHSFTLASPTVSSIVEVLLDGVALPFERFHLQGNILTVDPQVIPMTAQVLTVRYLEGAQIATAGVP